MVGITNGRNVSTQEMNETVCQLKGELSHRTKAKTLAQASVKSC